MQEICLKKKKKRDSKLFKATSEGTARQEHTLLLQLAKVQKGKVSRKRRKDKRTGEAQTDVNKGSQG